MDVIAAIASGTTIDAPRLVIVPETLMTGRSPRDVRMSSLGIVLSEIIAAETEGIAFQSSTAMPLQCNNSPKSSCEFVS